MNKTNLDNLVEEDDKTVESFTNAILGSSTRAGGGDASLAQT